MLCWCASPTVHWCAPLRCYFFKKTTTTAWSTIPCVGALIRVLDTQNSHQTRVVWLLWCGLSPQMDSTCIEPPLDFHWKKGGVTAAIVNPRNYFWNSKCDVPAGLLAQLLWQKPSPASRGSDFLPAAAAGPLCSSRHVSTFKVWASPSKGLRELPSVC